jgi:hypothetical protein
MVFRIESFFFRKSYFWFLAIVIVAMFAAGAQATPFIILAKDTTYYQNYGSDDSQNITVNSGSYNFQVNGIAKNKNTTWWVNGVDTGVSQFSGSLAIDPEYSYTFTSGTTVITAKVFNNGWGLKEIHIWNVTVQQSNHSPSAPSNPDPYHGKTNVSISTDLNCSCSDPDGDTVYYTIYLEKNDSSPDNVIKNDATGSYADPGTLDYNSHYYWRVKADDHKGGVTWGPVWDFYTINTYSITASAGSGGTITPSGAVTVNSGADQSFTIAADTGYSITDVLVDGASAGAVANYTFTKVTADHTIEASFLENEPYHPADTDSDYVIGDFELLGYNDLWAQGQVGDFEHLDTIDLWAAGHYYWDESEQKFKPGEEPP